MRVVVICNILNSYIPPYFIPLPTLVFDAYLQCTFKEAEHCANQRPAHVPLSSTLSATCRSQAYLDYSDTYMPPIGGMGDLVYTFWYSLGTCTHRVVYLSVRGRAYNSYQESLLELTA
jgi:hypothetical protein